MYTHMCIYIYIYALSWLFYSARATHDARFYTGQASRQMRISEGPLPLGATPVRTLHDATGHYITLHYITLHHITLYYIILHYITLYYIILHYITLYYIILHYITLHYITLYASKDVGCGLILTAALSLSLEGPRSRRPCAVASTHIIPYIILYHNTHKK